MRFLLFVRLTSRRIYVEFLPRISRRGSTRATLDDPRTTRLSFDFFSRTRARSVRRTTENSTFMVNRSIGERGDDVGNDEFRCQGGGGSFFRRGSLETACRDRDLRGLRSHRGCRDDAQGSNGVRRRQGEAVESSVKDRHFRTTATGRYLSPLPPVPYPVSSSFRRRGGFSREYHTRGYPVVK